MNRHGFLLLAAIAPLATAGCGQRSGDSSLEPSDAPLPLNAVIISDAVSQLSPEGTLAFVSMLPEALPTGVEVTIRNALTGDLKTVPIINGGWDPVAIAARAGDTVRITVKTAEGQSHEYANVIPLHRRPMILRTEPQPGLNDARLNTRMVVVFTEPIDPTTATRARVQLRRRGLPVANEISFSTGNRPCFNIASL